ncbi:UDP-N-acetylmuramoyl-L-alanyl-D-glutamate--2,6-diaminopimelate ligase [Bifidobacterium catulorum]|uniref:UDP-N-acetylmuramoyl-L-alanyl-D-glutamate--2, 6-diaminopimelate ligase n=1 Tax=Bifidobacterium catulorum TaxID=1630173 RepID=A0A2U2MSR4_9BIFI|nr:UDP-N-acetylmuramoyl-L-alanyl-D-glutamate--2,6-diaminopimelate ligase [Bifidobacterium catulorum]PWG59885.1 UDP-N-acetylmuramoyl-L-alanyl-D-glutamate--2,6-diaminopimelate ligase [Bifidobacterium catulorum]
MTLTLTSAVDLLKKHHLLREIITPTTWTTDPGRLPDTEFTAVSYDSRSIDGGTLLFCKGRFKPEYLAKADEAGLPCYVAETDYSDATAATGLIVQDVRKAMSLLSAEFYGRPQDSLTVIGVTGTKGKTTTSYFTQAILNAVSHGRAALFSSVDNCLDGRHYEESDLTTPESMDAFRMMRAAVDNGMEYLVMEVSSQAYKVDRVYGLTFDVGAFLNISPDHISPIEHPTFEDYLYCKRQLIANSRRLVLNADAMHADLLREDAAAHGIDVDTFALHGADGSGTPADVTAAPADADHIDFDITCGKDDLGRFHLSIDGDFNYANAAAAIAIVRAAGVPIDDAEPLHALESVRIAGRMEQFTDPQSDTLAIVDYAHNYASVTALLDFVDERYGARNPYVTLVTGSAGNKAYDRREEIVKAAQDRIGAFIFTAEDTDTEPFIDICMQMQGYITNRNVASTVISDRTTAITTAVYDARAHQDRFDVILAIGKGDERWIKEHNRHVPFEGDDRVIGRLFGLDDDK